VVNNAISTLGGILDDYHPVKGLEERRKRRSGTVYSGSAFSLNDPL
jgi:hypothetical protein